MGNGPAKTKDFEDPRCKIMLVGEHGAGKTTLVRTYKHLIEGSLEPDGSLENASCNLVLVRDSFKEMKVKVLCMDSFNIEDFQLECRLKAIRNTNMCMLVMDVSDSSKFENVPQLIELLIKNDYTKTLMIVGTKGDLGTDAHAAVENFMAEQHFIPIEYYVVSGTSGEGVAQVFQRALELCLSRRSIRWHSCRGLLYVYNMTQTDITVINEPPPNLLGNICEAIPQFFYRRNKPTGFPVSRLNMKLLQELTSFI